MIESILQARIIFQYMKPKYVQKKLKDVVKIWPKISLKSKF